MANGGMVELFLVDNPSSQGVINGLVIEYISFRKSPLTPLFLPRAGKGG